MKKTVLFLSVLTFFTSFYFLSCSNNHSVFVIKGGTLIDLSDMGNSDRDIEDSVILIRDKKIIAAGDEKTIEIPEKAKVIDVSGKYIIPGLIDGFAAINNQAYANAYLYMGITSIVAVSGGRRGDFYKSGNPTPSLFELGDVGFEKVSDMELINQIEKQAEKGVKILLLMYKLFPDQLKIAVKKAHELGMGTIGELGFSSYSEGMESDVDVFVHSTRYSIDAVPDKMHQSVAESPFSDDLNSPKWLYYKYLSEIDLKNKKLLKHAKNLCKSDVFIMPTLSLLYLDLPDHKNPWKEPVAKILKASDINNPADKITGNHNYDSEHQSAYTNLAKKVLQIEKLYHKSGAKYLAGSAADVWGTMPGISLHTELKLLHKIGLTNRQAIAAATANFSKAYKWRHTGRVKKGFYADLLVLKKNPLIDLENLKEIDMIFLKGEMLDRQKLLNKSLSE